MLVVFLVDGIYEMNEVNEVNGMNGDEWDGREPRGGFELALV